MLQILLEEMIGDYASTNDYTIHESSMKPSFYSRGNENSNIVIPGSRKYGLHKDDGANNNVLAVKIESARKGNSLPNIVLLNMIHAHYVKYHNKIIHACVYAVK